MHDVRNAVAIAGTINYPQLIINKAALGTSDAGVILVNTTSNNVAVTLPAASTTLMYQFIIKRISAGANTLTINTVSGNIDGSATKSIPTQYDSVTIRSDGTNYWLV